MTNIDLTTWFTHRYIKRHFGAGLGLQRVHQNAVMAYLWTFLLIAAIVIPTGISITF